jgi:sugar phosphate isomerase/epimerase
MDIICASICFRGYVDDEVAGTLDFAPAMGYKCMEIHGPMSWTPDAAEALDPDALKPRLAAAGIRCAGIYPPGWGGADAADVAAHARAIARCASVAEALGAGHIACTGAQQRGDPGAFDRVADCIARVLDQVPPATPVKLCLEPHFGNILQEPDDFDRLLTRFDDSRLGLCVDTGHFHSAGADQPALIRHFAARIYNVHLKDHLGSTSVGIGRGEVDLAAIVAALREIGYDAGLTVELEVEDPENLPRYTREAYIYLSGLLGQKL